MEKKTRMGYTGNSVQESKKIPNNDAKYSGKAWCMLQRTNV